MKPLPLLLSCLLALIPIASPAADDTPSDGLAAALRATLANHPAVAGKRAEVAASGYVVESRRALWYPTLSGQAGYDNNQQKIASVSLDQPVWAFGKISRPIAEAEANVDAEKLGLLQLQRQLLENTAAAYGYVLGLRQRETIASEDVAAHQSLYDHIAKRQQGQLASKADVNLAYARLVQAQAQREGVRGQLQVALRELQALTQRPNLAASPVAGGLLQLPATATLEDQVVAHSADARYKRALIDLAQRTVESAQVASMPTLSLRASHTYQDQYYVHEDNQVSLVLAGSLDGLGRVSAGRVSEARARETAAQQDLYTTLNDLRRRVDTLAETRALQATLMRSRQESVTSLQATMDSYFRQYRSGHKTWLEVLNMRRELTDQRLQLAQAENDWRDASLRLLAMSGGLDALAGLVEPHD